MQRLLSRNPAVFLLIMFCVNALDAQTWEIINMSFPEGDTLLNSSSILFATKNIGWIGTSGPVDTNIPPSEYSTKIFKTTDGGHNWMLQYRNSSYGGGLFFAIDSLHCWAYGGSGNLLCTSDGGATWDTSSISGEMDDYFTSMFFFNSQTGIAFNRYRWFTTDGGRNWSKGGDTIMTFPSPWDVYFINDRLGWMVSEMTPYSTDAGYIAHTTDGGKTWSYQDSIALKMLAVDFIDSLRGFAVGTNWNNSTGFIYSTIDGGNIWTWKQFIGSGVFWDIGFLDDKNGWITSLNKILITTDGVETCETQLQGLQSELRKLIVLKKDKVAYAFGDNHYQVPFTLLYADLSDLTNVGHNEIFLPKEFHLMQNYPNPFNPTTLISYQIPEEGFVTMRIYDVMGREVSTLINQRQKPGKYNVEFNASNLSNGMYFYQLKVNNYISTKKMMLVK